MSDAADRLRERMVEAAEVLEGECPVGAAGDPACCRFCRAAAAVDIAASQIAWLTAGLASVRDGCRADAMGVQERSAHMVAHAFLQSDNEDGLLHALADELEGK